MSWQPNPQEETTLDLLTRHFLGDIEYAIKTIQRHENRNIRMGQMICGFWHYNNETFLDIRYDSRLPNQRDEVLDSWKFGLGCYTHRKILIHSQLRTTGYWQRQWSNTYMAMHMEAEKEAYAWEWE
jgi:hypothetical protein